MSVREASEFGRVAVLMGGRSAEREISLMSGGTVLRALTDAGVDAHSVDPEPGVVAQLQDGGFDRAFIALHGRGGEDGTVQGALELAGIPYTGSGVLGSALAMDKLRSKRLWHAMGMPTPDFVPAGPGSDSDEIVETLGLPVFVKPSREGSSIGMSRVDEVGALDDAIRDAARYDAEVIVERFVEGGEYTFSVLGDRILPSIRIETPRSFYDYEAKYFTDSTRYHCPSDLGDADEERIAALARRAFDAVAASGWGRVDFMVDADGAPWLLEVNTVPGMTDHSLVPMAAQAAGLDIGALVWRILETSFHGRPGGGGA